MLNQTQPKFQIRTLDGIQQRVKSARELHAQLGINKKFTERNL